MPNETEKSAAEPQRVRRVGTVTLGVTLIVGGVAVCAVLFNPSLDITFLFKLAPLVLIALGAEILWSCARGDKCRYDILSMLLCFVLVISAIAAACVPYFLQWYGPERQRAEAVLRAQWYDAIYEKLGTTNAIDRVNLDLYFDGPLGSEPITLADFLPADHARAGIYLAGSYADKEEFVAACLPVIKAVRESGVKNPDIGLSTCFRGEAIAYALNLSGAYQLESTPERLAELVEVQYYHPDFEGYQEEPYQAPAADDTAPEEAAPEATTPDEPAPEATTPVQAA